MLLHPGVIALVVGTGLTLLLLAAAAILGLQILRRWDIKSNSEAQLALERRTYLVSTLVQYALLFDVISVFLFIYTADDMHRLLVGAMCATGSLNANAYGFPALYAQIISLFLAGAWIALNHVDSRAEDYPLTRTKYRLLMLVLPAVGASFVLELLYFSGIEPNVITSCCGTLFSEAGTGPGSSIASLPHRPMKLVLGAAYLAILASAALTIRTTGRRLFAVMLAALSTVFFFAAIASVVSFISLYYYQLPSHHCPFDILQAGYYYAGYPLYISLFVGCFFGQMTGVLQAFRRVSSLSSIIGNLQRQWALVAAVALTVFVILVTVPMIFSPFTLEGY